MKLIIDKSCQHIAKGRNEIDLRPDKRRKHSVRNHVGYINP